MLSRLVALISIASVAVAVTIDSNLVGLILS